MNRLVIKPATVEPIDKILRGESWASGSFAAR
jgi:hypothetical protein